MARIKELGIDQREAARRIGCDYDKLNKWIKQGSEPQDHFEGLMAFLGVDIYGLGALVIGTRMERASRRRR